MNKKRKHSLWLLALAPILALAWWSKSVASWRPQLVGVQKGVQTCLLSPDGQLLLAHDGNGGGQVWDVAQQCPLWKNESPCPVFSPDSRWLAAMDLAAKDHNGLFNVQFSLRDARTGRIIRRFLDSVPRPDCNNEVFHDAIFSPDGRQFKMVTSHRLRRYDVATGRLAKVIETGFFRGQFSPNEEVFSVGLGNNGVNVKISDARTGRHLNSMEIDIEGDSHFPFAFSPDGTLVEVEGMEGVGVYRITDKKRLFHFDEEVYVNSIVSQDSNFLYHPTPAGLDVFNVHTGRKLNTLPGPGTTGLALSPDGNWFYEARDDKIYRWRAR